MIRKVLMPLTALALICSISCVYATWNYAENSPDLKETNVSIRLNLFEYPPEEILPGGDMEDAPLGESHFNLIYLILNERDKGYGLNASNNNVLHKYLKQQTVVYSNQKVSGGNLKFILDPKNNTNDLYYCLERVSDTLVYAYTFSISELATSGGSNTEIVVYRTSLEKKTQWESTVSYMGYATTKSLNDLGVGADPNTIAYSIDVETWQSHLG